MEALSGAGFSGLNPLAFNYTILMNKKGLAKRSRKPANRKRGRQSGGRKKQVGRGKSKKKQSGRGRRKKKNKKKKVGGRRRKRSVPKKRSDKKERFCYPQKSFKKWKKIIYKMEEVRIEGSRPGFRSQLNLFEVEYSDISCPSSTYTTVGSRTHLSDIYNATTFHVPPTAHTYYDLANSYVYIRVSTLHRHSITRYEMLDFFYL
jgi:hypothetical protein